MNSATNPIAVTSILSVLLHGVVVATLLILYGQTMPDNAVGQGVEIELISSVRVSTQDETDVSRKQQNVAQAIAKKIITKKTMVKKNTAKSQYKKKNIDSLPILASLSTVKNSYVLDDKDEHHERKFDYQIVPERDSITTVARSTAASEQQHSILELLHSRIADNKKYPYMAKRQRREGVSTVAFILHPSGMIEDMYLINSSQTTALDRAALAAVKNIEPFKPAQQYLEQAKAFKVDVVFELL